MESKRLSNQNSTWWSRPSWLSKKYFYLFTIWPSITKFRGMLWPRLGTYLWHMHCYITNGMQLYWTVKYCNFMTIQLTSTKLSVIVETLLYIALRFWHRKWRHDKMKYDSKRQSLIGLWNVASKPNIYIKYCDFVPRFYGKTFIVYHALCKRIMCPVKKPQIVLSKTHKILKVRVYCT